MINKKPESIEFRFDGANSRTLDCNYVEYGIEILGEVDEELDYTLIENYSAVRLVLELELVLFLSDATWFSSFIKSMDKYMTIDGANLQVVNDFKDLKFPRWKDYNLAVNVKAKFKSKVIGFPEWKFDGGGHIEIGVI